MASERIVTPLVLSGGGVEPRGTKGVPRPKFERETKPDYTGDACPKCQSRRVWISGETLRCRDCGTRFVPDDLPPAEEESGS